jgi:hypothetical protein
VIDSIRRNRRGIDPGPNALVHREPLVPPRELPDAESNARRGNANRDEEEQDGRPLQAYLTVTS